MFKVRARAGIRVRVIPELRFEFELGLEYLHYQSTYQNGSSSGPVRARGGVRLRVRVRSCITTSRKARKSASSLFIES